MLVIGSVIVAQQHSYTQADIDAGSRLYENSCGGCHGENGDRVTGIDFVKGQFKTARTDEDIVRIIRNGIPNTAMPSQPFTEPQAETIVAYVRSMLGGVSRPGAVDAPPGDPARGKALVEGKANCVSCHSVNGLGATTAPDLALIGARGGRGGGGGGGAAAGAGAAPPRGAAPAAQPNPQAAAGAPRGADNRGATAPAAAANPPAAAAPARGGGGGGRGGNAPNPQQLLRSILDPNAEIAAAYRQFRVTPRTGDPVTGSLLNQDTFSVQLRDPAGNLRGFQKQDLREWGFLPSPMPSYKDKLTSQELADVVSYLISLRSN
jgi:putative heme-binding domain-containing protein